MRKRDNFCKNALIGQQAKKTYFTNEQLSNQIWDDIIIVSKWKPVYNVHLSLRENTIYNV